MNAPANIRRNAQLDALLSVEASQETRAVRMAAAIYDVWQVLESGKAQPHPVAAETLDGIERELAHEVYHGKTFAVLETPTLSDRAKVHFYRVRRGKWNGRYVDARRDYPHSADRLFSVEVTAFDPVEPWRCVAGADRLGRSNLIEARS